MKWLILDPLSGHRYAWAVELGLLAQKIGTPLGVIAVCDLKKKSIQEFPDLAQDLFTSVVIVRNGLMLKEVIQSASRQDTHAEFLFMDLEKHIFWLIRNRMKFKGVFMRPYLEGYKMRSILIWLMKRMLTTVSQLVPTMNIRLLAIPFQRQRRAKRSWIRDDLTLSKCMASMKKNSPKINERFKNSIVVPGFLDTRKGIELAVSGLHHSRNLIDENLNLFFIGSATSSFLEAFSKVKEDSITLEDGFLSDSDFVNLLFSSRIILLPYANRGASGIVIEALVVGTPVVIVGRNTWRNLSFLSNGLVQFSRPNPKSVSRSIQRAQISKATGMADILSTEDLNGLSKFFLND
jgi:glycosyltransferase involved in cell wall biosynthesis